MRLTRTVDVPAGASSASLDFQLNFDTEAAYDHVIVEAHTPGEDDWTTLPEANGLTQTAPPAECVAGGFLLSMHPFLTHYLGGADCTEPGTTGTWDSFTGPSEGWQQVSFDLSRYAGQSVELSISYVTDPATGGVGAFVDDTRVVIDGVTDADGFEDPTSDWTPAGSPPGSAPNSGDWEISEALLTVYAGTSTEDTDLFGFGLEQLPTADRLDLLERSLDDLLQ
jgi:bacillopeptidase F (M6 metalloprotease family)